jgi:anaerobic magnesium-protoporphyrin IX monomethyl ester cyclase
MNVTLVRAPLTLSKFASAAPAVPPIGMAYIAASLQKAGHNVDVIDSTGDAIDQYIPHDEGVLYRGLTIDQIVDKIKPCDVIGISIMFSQDWPLARKLIDRIHDRFAKTVIIAGGEHVTAEPVGSMEDTSALGYVIPGEGDIAVCELMEFLQGKMAIDEIPGVYYRDGKNIRQSSGAKRIRAVDDLPWPAWDLFPLENYLEGGHGWGVNRGRNMPLLASRGCPYECTFCSSPVMWTQRWIVRSPEDVIAEIKHYIEKFRATNFDFQDLTAIIKKEWIMRFCRMLIQEKLNITWQLPTGTRSEAIDEDVAPLLYASGCMNITYAPESGDPVVLKKIKKKIKTGKVIASARACVRAGLNVKANFIFGFPEDTYLSHWETFKFITKLAVIGLYDISVAPFSAYPGSELFRDLQAAGKIPLKLDDEYYKKIPFADQAKTISWAGDISSEGLNRLRNFALIWFYLISYSLRPHRFLKTIWNFFSGKEESRMDKALADMKQRLIKLFRKRPTLTPGNLNPF